ncbi:hypothetical protein Avbf_19029 [Armadillidium vulgare]|nr:hypothetical protein Avbf_19029 [Armadillidium vulgare]
MSIIFFLRFTKDFKMERKFLQFIKLMKNLNTEKFLSFQINYSSIALSLSKVPKDSSLIWFEDVKQCLNSKNFCTFIKICCNEKNVTPFVIIETFDQCFCNKFIKLCTGECGPSYKGSFFKKGHNKRINFFNDLTNVLSVYKNIENESEKMRLKDYKRC